MFFFFKYSQQNDEHHISFRINWNKPNLNQFEVHDCITSSLHFTIVIKHLDAFNFKVDASILNANQK